MNPVWTFVLCDRLGVPFGDLSGARDRKLSFKRNRAAQIELTIDVDDSRASQISAELAVGFPRVRAYRDGVLRANTYWSSMEETAGEGDDAGSVKVTFRGPFAVYEKRWTARTVSYGPPNVEIGELSAQLIETANVDSPQGPRMERGLINTEAAGVFVIREYQHKQVAEAIVELTRLSNGFEFNERFIEDPVEPDVLALFDTANQLGSDLSTQVIFEFGRGTRETVKRVTRQWLAPTNRVRLVGSEGSQFDTNDAASIAAYGLIQENADRGSPPDLAIVDTLLRPKPRQLVTLEPSPVRGPQPFDDYYIGDTVSIRARQGSLQIDTIDRINGIDITIDADGNELAQAVTLESQGE